MKFLIINTDYSHFIKEIYQKEPWLFSASFIEQYNFRIQTLFGMNNFYSLNLCKLGHKARDIIYNNPYMNYAYATENGLRISQEDINTSLPISSPLHWFTSVFREQVKAFKPDVIVNLAMETVTSEILNTLKPDVQLIIGQHASPLTPTMEDLSAYDIILSSLPNLVNYFREKGKKSIYFKLGFESTILDTISTEKNRTIDVVFIGGFSEAHQKGTQLFNYLAEKGLPITLYGYGEELLSPKARRCFNGPLYGRDLYEIYSRAKIAINRHIDISGKYANNMRLYEATGMGALLVTDFKKNLGEIFDIGNEVVAYHSEEECAELIQYYLANEEERMRIATNGQKRTLSEHTYYHRMSELIEIVKTHFRDKIHIRKNLNYSSANTNLLETIGIPASFLVKSGDKIFIFGAGNGGRRCLKIIKKMGGEIKGIIDNDKNKQGSTLEGIPIFGPERLMKKDFDKIIIASMYWPDIQRQLLEQGFKKREDFDIFPCYSELKLGLMDSIERSSRQVLKIDRSNLLKSCLPISRVFGLERGQPIDRFYIEKFLKENKHYIQGRVLEVGDNNYTLKYGKDRVTQSDILHYTNDNPKATIIGDLATGTNLQEGIFDCFILTQTLPFIFDVKEGVKNAHRVLKPGGVLLATVPGISQISRYDMEKWGDYWRFTTASVRRLFEKFFHPENIEIKSYGNVLTATAFLYGLASEELEPHELEYNDPDYQVLITICAIKEK